MAATRENQVVFLKGKTPDGTPMIVLGVTREAWVYMKDGKTHTFDLTKAGLPMRLVMFGAKDHAEAMKTIEAIAAKDGMPLLDERRKDFSI
jgi:hypothetical protein